MWVTVCCSPVAIQIKALCLQVYLQYHNHNQVVCISIHISQETGNCTYWHLHNLIGCCWATNWLTHSFFQQYLISPQLFSIPVYHFGCIRYHFRACGVTLLLHAIILCMLPGCFLVSTLWHCHPYIINTCISTSFNISMNIYLCNFAFLHTLYSALVNLR